MIVLVHGAFHGAWCFERVVPLLRDAGVNVIAVDLPGHGDDPGPFTDLHGDAARVRSVLDAQDGPVVLLGHSYGGAVVTEAGDHPAVAHLVYLCALALDEGEACSTVWVTDEEGTGIAGALVDRGDGTATLAPEGAARSLYNDCDDSTVAWALARLGPQPLQNMAEVPAAVAWRGRPSTYVVCTADCAVPPTLQRALAKRCTTSVEWPTSHSPFLSRPELVADLLVGLEGG